jgi:hypothetical protein
VRLAMNDFTCVALSVAFFALCVAYAHFCARIR